MSEERESTDHNADAPAVEGADESDEPDEPGPVTDDKPQPDEAVDPAHDEAGDDEAGDEAGDEARDEARDEAEVGPRRPRLRLIAAAVLALGLLGAAYEGWLLFAHHQRAVAAAQALDAAERYALVLTGVDPAAIDKNFAEVLDGATGDFKDMYAASSEQLRQLLIDNKAAAHGTVIDGAVKSATKNRVEVMLFIDQSVSNKAEPQTKIDRSRIVMTMEKVNGRWLAAEVDMP